MSDIREMLMSGRVVVVSEEVEEWKTLLAIQMSTLTDELLVELFRMTLSAIALRMAGEAFPSMEIYEHTLKDALDCAKKSVDNDFS